jgi:hypothetical protein
MKISSAILEMCANRWMDRNMGKLMGAFLQLLLVNVPKNSYVIMPILEWVFHQ